jgi:hypothetical protein
LFGELLGKNRELSGVIGESGKIGKKWGKIGKKWGKISGFRFFPEFPTRELSGVSFGDLFWQ